MSASARAAVAHLFDYAGLFPPAQLGMADAVRRYASYRGGEYAWMLGRFVVPGSRLNEFAQAAEPLLPAGGDPWRVSAVFGDDPARDAAAVAAFNAAHRPVVCDSAEAKAADADDVARIAAASRRADVAMYVEIAASDDPQPMLAAVAAHRVRAKIRTGGVTAAAFPDAAAVVRFIAACLRAGVPFKATAGLHHALRGEYALAYEPASERSTMFGFLNVILAAALLRDGGSATEAEALLAERDPAALSFGDDGARWRDRLFLTARIAQMREGVALAIGSCSFVEPIDELRALELVA